jgi:hypothetical protein
MMGFHDLGRIGQSTQSQGRSMLRPCTHAARLRHEARLFNLES